MINEKIESVPHKSKLSLEQRLFLVTETYKRISDTNEGRVNRYYYSYVNMNLIKEKLINIIEQMINFISREGIPGPDKINESEKNKIVNLLIDGIVLDDYGKLNELIICIDSLGFSMEPIPHPTGKERLYMFYSGDVWYYYGLLEGKLGVNNKQVMSGLKDIPGLYFMMAIGELLKTDVVSGLDKEVKKATDIMYYKIASYFCSVYATYSAERGGTIYLSSPIGLRANNYFWHSELPILRALQKKGLIGDIRILHEPIEFYQDKPLEEIGSLLTGTEVGMIIDYERLPTWLQQEALEGVYKYWLYVDFYSALASTRRDIINYLEQDTTSPKAAILRFFLERIHGELDEIRYFDTLTRSERAGYIKNKIDDENQFEHWFDNFTVEQVNESRMFIDSLVEEKRNLPIYIGELFDSTIPLEFNSNVININTEGIKRKFLPFYLLREQWKITISERNLITATLVINTPSGRKIKIMVESRHNQLGQIATLERFILANYTSRNIPDNLQVVNNTIICDTVILAEKDNNYWISHQAMIENSKLNAFNYFLRSNRLNIEVNDDGFKLYSIDNEEDNRVISAKINDDLHMKIVMDFIVNSYDGLAEIPSHLMVKVINDSEEYVFAYDQGIAYVAGLRENNIWRKLSPNDVTIRRDFLQMVRKINIEDIPEQQAGYSIENVLSKYHRLVRALPVTHPRVWLQLVELKVILSKNIPKLRHPKYVELMNHLAYKVGVRLEFLKEIIDFNPILQYEINPGTYINTWQNVSQSHIFSYYSEFGERNAKPQLILQLHDDLSLLERSEIFASYNPDQSVIIQIDLESSEARIVFGAMDRIQNPTGFELIISIHSNEYGDSNVLSIYEVYKKAIKQFHISQPVKIILSVSHIGDHGGGPLGFRSKHPALRFVNMLHRDGLDIPVIAFTTEVGNSPQYPGRISTWVTEDLNTPLLNLSDHQVNYHYINEVLFINGTAVIELLITDVKNKIKTIVQLIALHSEYLIPYFSDNNGIIDIRLLTLTINNEDKHSQFLNYLDITKRKPNLRKGNNWQSVVKNNPAVFKMAPLSEFLVEHPDIHQVNDWDLLSISKVNKIDESMHYDMQIIFQCENDPIVNRAAVRLAGKHPRNSIVIQLDANSHYRAFIMNENPYSGWHQLSEQEWIKRLKAIGGKGNLRWQVVGHGRMNDEHDGHHQTLAGQSAKKLAENLSAFTHNLKIEHRISIKPSQVSLVGCSMSSDDRNNSFAHDFMFKLHKFSIKTNVSAAITALEVGSGGHKLKAHIEDNNLSGNQTEQLYWNHWGEMTTVRKENMQKRLKNIIGIIDSLVSGHLAITELSNKQRRQLAEWFPQSTNKNINTNELLLTLHDPMRIQSLNENLKFIHKIARNDFFDDISIISALGKIKDRSDKVLKSIKHLSNLSVDIDYHVQSLYFSNNNNMMRKLAQTYTYFYSQKQEKLFLDALSIDSDIYNRQQESIVSVTELDDMHRFRQLLNDIKETDCPPFFQENLSELPVGSYQLSHDNYHFAIIVKNDDSGINKIIFYDPNIGTITNISHDRVRDYLIDNYSLPKERALRLSIMDNPSNTHQFLSLQHFLQLGFNTEYQRIKTIDINSFGLTVKATLLYKAGLSFEGKPIVDAGEFSKSNPIISQLKVNPVAFDLFMATASDVDAMIVAQWLQRYMRLYAGPSDILLEITEGINVTGNINLRLTTEHKLTGIKNHDFKNNSKSHILSLLKKPSSFYGAFGRMGYAMQGYGLISAFRLVADYKRQLNSGELNTEQNREMQQQLALVWGGVGANIAINALQFAFRIWGIRYLQKIIGNGAVMTPALLSRITLLKHHPTLLLNSHFLKDLRQLAIRQTASGIARFTLPILSVITSGIDIYQAYYAFSRLANETDPHIRRDLMASGIFSTINAAIGLGVAISMAVGGTVGIMAGPVGIILAATMMVAGEIYSAVSQIERIRDIVPDMTGGQRFENGLRLFLKFPLAPGVDNQIRYNQTLSHIQQQQHDYYQELLGRSVGVDTLFYSRGDIILQSIPFIKRDDRSQFVQITEKVRAFLGDPLENARIYTEYAERGQHEYYQLDNIKSVNDTIIADNIKHESNASVVKIEKLNLYHTLSELSGESVKGDFILHGDMDHNGVNDFIVIYGKCHTYFASTKNSLGFSSLEDYIDSWYYEIDFFLANTNGGYSKINQVLPSEQLPMAILEKEFSNMAFPLLGDFNGDEVPELIIFSHNGMTVYNYDSVLFPPTEGVDGFTSHSGGFINPIKQSLYEGYSLDYPYSLVGDINRDGFDDVLLFNKQGEMLQLSGNSRHEFNQSKISLPTELHDLLSSLTPHRSQLQLADLNKDGFLDLIVILDDGAYYRSWGKKIAENYTFDTPIMINKITFREEEGSRVRYSQNRLAKIEQNKIISLSQSGLGGHNLISLSKQGEIHAHPLSELKENDVAALYDLGDGHDIAEGYSKKRNIFTVGEGVKEYKGGENADTFILTKFIGTNIHILNGDKGNDTVTLGETLDKNIHSVIDINTGYYSQVSHDSEKRVALLYNFENVIGHESVNDKIMGTDWDNYLNGMGAEDEIHAYAGNDVLVLEAGVANGGQGLDNYHILKNSRDYPVKIRIEEEQENDSEKLPTSNILLDHKLNEIISIELEQLDILIKLRSGDGYITEIRLIGIYETQDNYKQQVLSFNIQTADGFTLTPLWPTFFNEESEFSPKMVAYYLPLTDRGYKHLLGKNSPESMVVQLSLGLHQQQHVVTHISRIEGEKDKILRQCILPDFVTLSPREHPLLIGFLPHYELLGDQHDNIFQALKGQGLLTGYGGNDTYFIQEEMDNPTEIRIDNHDNSLATDTLLLASWLLSDIIIEADGDDVLLHHREQSEKHQRIRLLNYMADESYRHLIITDKSGQSQYRDSTVGEFVYYRVDIDSENRPFIAAQQMPAVSTGNDEVVIHAATFLPENSIDSGDGNDALIYIRGRENTTLRGGTGDDTYYYSAGSGVINIEESSGEDQLYLDKTIGLHTLSAERRENNLILNLQDDALNRITFIDWYLGQGKQLEFIWVEDSQITFDELFSVRPYSNVYYQLCQELNSMGLTLSVRQLADIDSSDGYNTINQLNTIKYWAVDNRINRPVDMDYLVSLATVAWQYYSREADPLPLIRERINQICQPLIVEHISLTVEQLARVDRDNLSTRSLADKVSQYHLRRPEDIDYLLDQLDSINRSPLDDRVVDFALRNRIDLTQPDIELCWQEYGFSRQVLIQWAIRYSINSREKFNLMLSNIQVLKEFGVVFSEGQPPLALNKSLNLRHYFNQKKLTAEHIAQLSEQDMTFDQLILRLDRGMNIEQAFIAEPEPAINPEPLLTPELIDESGLSIGSLTEAMGAMDSVETYPEFVSQQWMPQSAVVHSPSMNSMGIN